MPVIRTVSRSWSGSVGRGIGKGVGPALSRTSSGGMVPICGGRLGGRG
jgi:hypothetical protein